MAMKAMFGRDTRIDGELNHRVMLMLQRAGAERLLPIVQAGDPVLRRVSKPYRGQLAARTLRRLIETMRVTMLAAPGVGLAAPQIGLGLAFAVVEDHAPEPSDSEAGEGRSDPSNSAGSEESADGESGWDPQDDPREIADFPFHEIINPVYEPSGKRTASFYEGCLSFDGYQAVRRRWLDITARWQDARGVRHREHLHGWPARIFQHETDHLSGELYIDKAEIRSLSTSENLGALWADDPRPIRASEELGFSL